MLFTSQPTELLVTVLAVIAAFAPPIAAESFASTIIYTGKDCSGTPLVVSVIGSVDCEAVECVLFIADSVTYSSETTCETTDRQTYVADTFAGSSYVMIETYSKLCTFFLGAMAFLATGECQVYDDHGDNYYIAKVNKDGSASQGIYNDSSCTGSPFLGYEPDSETVSSHSCYNNYSVIYTSSSSTATSSSVSVSTRSQTASSSRGNSGINVGSNGISPSNSSIIDEAGSETTVSTTPVESSGGVSTGAIVGILVAYVILCVAACILCMDRMENFIRSLGLRR
ncbi:hypothetical protein F441_21415 [Phytophthora nicotianae CJ01A1]|uniref:Uncharacterized protein n=4 Tax=Phytophthora nicotianae TaxID=4792 RepID=V9DXW2_PHYNI|nr:hypothetical protein F443_21532 [Phytophthora nicotianae P1569]ETL25318.1 hypothetical protein L916_20811 [Phytophthora nicotianae]ETM31816.1 hypothetical protein L914_20677 [Phytophthora nicotianae]ETO60231.1 hypothetical protein F444_21545 [Phytophthora nicotianae P1976]ETP01322.1 hypothetical protein F441_21415 [Phytophthora nicotianae CJ01A1]